MGFLDNSGDIILDAVLTDAGRKRLAEGNGSFRIAKYAFGDDEVDYSNYNATNSSGSAYYDLEILQTPVLEAFTNNTASMKSKLMTLTNNNILYLPIIVLNKKDDTCQVNTTIGSGSHVVCVDTDTAVAFQKEFITGGTGLGFFIDGTQPGSNVSRDIRCDQGLDTKEVPATYKIDAELQENQYIVEIDNRFGAITTGGSLVGPAAAGKVAQSFSFIDDDNVASYYLSTTDYVKSTDAEPITNKTGDEINTAVGGPRGTHLVFRIQSSTNLRTSTFLFERLGGTFGFTGTVDAPDGCSGTCTFYYIDTIVRVTGATTGYKLDIPVRFVKKQ